MKKAVKEKLKKEDRLVKKEDRFVKKEKAHQDIEYRPKKVTPDMSFKIIRPHEKVKPIKKKTRSKDIKEEVPKQLPLRAKARARRIEPLPKEDEASDSSPNVPHSSTAKQVPRRRQEPDHPDMPTVRIEGSEGDIVTFVSKIVGQQKSDVEKYGRVQTVLNLSVKGDRYRCDYYRQILQPPDFEPEERSRSPTRTSGSSLR
jgi:hypothetical protein